MVTIRVHAVRVLMGDVDQGPHLQAICYMPSGQELGRGPIFAGHSPSVQADAVKEFKTWLREHRPGWHIETLPGEGVLTLDEYIKSRKS